MKGVTELKLKPVDHLPVEFREKGKYDKLLLKFAKSIHQVCEIEGMTKHTTAGLKSTIRRLMLHDRMWVARRGNRIYLFKVEVKKRG